MSPQGDDRAETEPDAWLRAALRHAPDAELGAPPALSAAILREASAARSAVGRRGSPWQALWDAWSWLARPPVAAGFASVMVAGVVGLMWWDRPLQESLPPAPGSRLTAPMSAAPAAAAAMSASDAAPAAAPPPPAAVAPAAPAAPALAKAGAAPKPQTRPPALPAPHNEARARVADAAPAPAETQPPQGLQADRAEQAVAEPEAARKMTAPSPPSLADAAAPAGQAAAAAPAAAAARSARAALAPGAAPASWQADVQSQPQRWAWQLDHAPPRAMTPALQAWLARVDALVAGAAPLPAPAAEDSAVVLHLLRDGRLHTRLILGTAGLWLLPAEGGRAPLSVALSPERADALKVALEAALR